MKIRKIYKGFIALLAGHFPKDRRGFNIVELAIVFVIFGLLITIAIIAFKPAVDRGKRNTTESKIDAAVDTIIGYAELRGRIPTTAEFPTVVSDMEDIWRNELVYVPDSNLTSDGSICASGSTDTTLVACDDSICSTPSETTNNVAFIVLSRGENLNIQTDITSSTIPFYPKDLPGIDDYDGTGLWSDPVGERDEPYKDIIKWIVLPELRRRLNCAGSALKILAIPLPPGLISKTYDGDIYATGGIPWDDGGDPEDADDYEWCVESALPSGMNYECNGDLSVSDPATDPCSLSSGIWQRCTSLLLEGTPQSSGSFRITVYARDDGGNIENRRFSLTISQIVGLNICPQYRVWNDASEVNKDYEMKDGEGFETGGCNHVPKDADITPYVKALAKQEVLNRLATSNSNCGGVDLSLTYNQAIVADTNADCCIWFQQVDKDCS